MELDLTTESRGASTVVRAIGEVDSYTAPQLRECLLDLDEKGEVQIIVDLERVDFLDSTGLGVLVGGLKRVRSKNGDLSLICTNKKILRVLGITGLDSIFNIHQNLPQNQDVI